MVFLPKSLFIVGGFFTNVIFFVSMKNAYETHAVDSHGVLRAARLPFLMFFLNFLMNCPLLLMAFFETPKDKSSSPNLSWDALGAAFTIVAPIVVFESMNEMVIKAGVVIIAASLFLTVRTLRIPFTALARMLYRGQIYTSAQLVAFLAIALCTALTTVAGSQYLVSPDGPQKLSLQDTRWTIALPGIAMAILSSFLSSFRSVIEEDRLRKTSITPLMCTGTQGVILTSVSAFFLGIVHALGYEDFRDTMAMIESSAILRGWLLLYALVSLADCYFMIHITAYYDSTVRMITATVGVFGCWAAQSAMYHFSGGSRGEFTAYPGVLYMMLGLGCTACAVIAYARLPASQQMLPLVREVK